MLKLTIAMSMTFFAAVAAAVSGAASVIASSFILLGIFVLGTASLKALKSALE